MIFRNLPAIGLLLLPGALAGIQDSGKDNLAAVLIKQLDKSQPMNVRLAAFKRFESGRVKDAQLAIPLLKQCCREKDGDIRRGAQAALGAIAFFEKLPCPAEVVEGLFDPEERVPNNASNYVGFVDNFAPECLPLLMKALASDDFELRSIATLPLIQFAIKDAKVLAALRKVADQDRYWSVRNNANVAVFKVTKDLAAYVRFRLEFLSLAIPGIYQDVKTDPADLRERERNTRDLILGMIPRHLAEFEKDRPEEMARILVNLLEDKSAPVRAMAVRRLGNLNDVRAITVLEKLQAQPLLARLSADPDRLVSTEATLVLAAFRLNRMLDNPAPLPNLIQKENSKPGSSDWQLTRVKVDKASGNFRSSAIEGYCSHQSVQAGDTLKIMVSTAPAARFQIEIFRTGYYGGKGARLMSTLGPLQGKEQPVPPVGERSLRECKWEPSAELKIPEDWVSGVYLGRLTTLPEKETEPYWQSYVVFIVRDKSVANASVSEKRDILFQCSDNTWQAYNRWPDKYSIYTNPKGVEGPWSDVSFDRPYAKYAQIYDNPQSIGSGEWLCFEFPLAYWLEQHGYDVSYCSNSDTAHPERLPACKAFLSVGHDEYWDIRTYNSVKKMRDSGVNLLFLSGNSVCWVTPQKPSSAGRPDRIIFRGGPYGGKYKFAELREKLNGPFPERGPDEGYLIGARNVDPVNGGGDWVATKPDHWIFKGTGMKKGDRVPGLIGWEYHGDPPKDLPGLEILAEGTAFQGGVRPQHWTATIYPGPKGNFVFNASTIFWSQGMSSPPGHMLPWSHWSRPHGPDERVQQITRNLLSKAVGGEK